ncbi:MAG: hypothetical protein NTZ40_01035 [Cyanobacteria bacterium]|nr:hypothetical protein [Cyanobacteriota bacterium]
MAISPPSISLNPNPHPALSYVGLRAEALELLGRLCGDQWSDFNSHDPGITILEQLCFALTELAYRSQWSIEDLIASAGPDWQPAAQEILSGDPVTRDDLIALVRALGCEAVRVEALDQPDLPLYFRPSTSASALPEGAQTNGFPPGAGDLELEPDLAFGFAASPQPAVVPRGVWRVAAQLGAMAQGSGPATLLPIAQRLHGARLLGRDFTLEVLDPFAVVVRAELEVDPAQATSHLMVRLQACLDQAIRRAGADDNGGGLRSGALIQVLLALPEVRQVTSFELADNPSGPWRPWHLSLPGGGARLHPASSLSLFHRGVRLAVPTGELRQAPPRPALAEPGSFGLPTSEPTTSSLRPADAGAAAVASPGRRRTLTSNRSLALDLPAVYGVGLAGLPAGASPERQQQAGQLRTYLLFFDQLLANGQTQLAQAIPLLSPVEADVAIGTAGQRQALLAHLLQRFGEELNPGGQPQAGAQTLVQARSDFLRRIVPLSGGRGSGPDLLAAAPEQLREDSQGAFAERLRRKLGLPLAPDGSPPLLVIEHLLLRPLPDDSSQRVQGGEDPIPFLADVARPDPWSARVSVVINAALLPPWPVDAPADACDRWLVNVVRQELPAHLVAELHLLADADASPGQGQGPWSAMVTAWCGFREQLRAQRRTGLGAWAAEDDLGKRLLSLRLRDRRDRLLSLLGIGLPWPLRGIPFKEEQVMVATGKSAAIELRYSQPGVNYQLVEVASGASIGEAAEGSDGPLTLTTPAISRDLILRVQASVLPPSPVATANGRLRSTLVAGEILVVEGVDPSLGLRLLDLSQNPLPPLHPEGAALLAHHGQGLLVEVAASQEGVVYEVIDNAQRKTPFANQKPLSAKVTGTSGPIVLELISPADEDQDLTVRASLERQRGRAKSEDRQVLLAVLPLRVRANRTLPLRLDVPVVAADTPASVAIGAAAAAGASGSQKSVRYQLLARPLADADWRFDAPATAPELTTIGDDTTGFTAQPASDQASAQTNGNGNANGNGAILTLQQVVSGEGMVLAALACKQHHLAPLGDPDSRTHPSEVVLHQAAVVLTQPDAQRPLLLRRQSEGRCVWSFWGGQPGVAYSLQATGQDGADTPLAPSVPLPELAEAPGGPRGIGRMRLGRDLLVAAADGPPRSELERDPAAVANLRLLARFLRSGVEVLLERPPILSWVEPAAVGRGDSAEVVVSGLAAAQGGRLLQGETLLQEGRADGEGRLRLATGPLPGATTLQLDVGVRCAVWIAQGVNTDLKLRVLNFNPLQPDAPAHLMDWGASAEVELLDTQKDVEYALIAAADRDKPLEQQQPLSPISPGTGGPLVLRFSNATEDVDLLVRGTRRLDDQGLHRASGYLATVIAMRVRANPDVSITLAQAVPELAEQSLLLVGDARTSSQSSVSYKTWSMPVTIDDLLFFADLPQAAGQQVNTLPPVLDGQRSLPPADRRLRAPVLPAPVDPNLTGWIGRGQPKKGTDGQQKAGNEGQLQLSLGQAKADAYLAVIASKQHSLGPAGSTWAGTGAASQVLIKQLVSQLIRPDPSQRLALVADTAGIDATGVGSVPSRWLLHGGEPGCFYNFLARGDGQPIALPVYVHRQITANPPAARGIGCLRLEVDLALAGASGPALETKADLAALRATVLRVSWAHTGSSGSLRRGPLWVAVEPTPVAAASSATVKVWGLQPNEQAKLMLQKVELAAPQVGSEDPAKSIDLVPGPLAESTVLDLVITADETSNIWKFPVAVVVTQPLG